MSLTNLKNTGGDQLGDGGGSRFLFKYFKYEKFISYPNMEIE